MRVWVFYSCCAFVNTIIFVIILSITFFIIIYVVSVAQCLMFKFECDSIHVESFSYASRYCIFLINATFCRVTGLWVGRRASVTCSSNNSLLLVCVFQNRVKKLMAPLEEKLASMERKS